MWYDTRRELREAVENKLGPVKDEDWDEVAPSYPGYDDQDLREVVRRLRARGYGRSRKKKRRVAIGGAVVRGMLVENKWERVQSLIKKFRLDFFGKAERPFSNLAEAAAWIEDQEARGGELVRIVCFDPGKLSDEDWDALRKGELDSIKAPAKHEVLYIDYALDDTFRLDSVAVRRGVLEDLYSVADSLVRWWGVSQSQAVAHILTGARTYRKPLTVQTTIGSKGAHPCVTITVTDPSASPRSVAENYIEARKKVWRVDRGRPLSARDTTLALFVKQTTSLSWGGRLKEWNRRHPDWAFDDTEPMRKAFERAIERAQ